LISILKEFSTFAFLKILLLDNYDSFTYMLKDYIGQGDVACTVMRNDDVNLLEEIDEYNAIVISPGPQTPSDAGQLMSVVKHFATTKPILGVCLGHQAIGMHFGAQLVKAQRPMHGKVDTIEHSSNVLFQHIPNSFSATRYHSLILQQLPEELNVIATSADNEVMGIAHKSLPLWGIQFHPESCTTAYGLQLIRNFLTLAQQNQ
jgi:anthranilate synthase/aminodeoxychorismate synthase-like glutamine amidotransferase